VIGENGSTTCLILSHLSFR